MSGHHRPLSGGIWNHSIEPLTQGMSLAHTRQVWLALPTFWSVVCWTRIIWPTSFPVKTHHKAKCPRPASASPLAAKSVAGGCFRKLLSAEGKLVANWSMATCCYGWRYTGQLHQVRGTRRMDIWWFAMMEENLHMLQQLNPLKHGWWALALFLPQSFKQLGWWIQQMYGDYHGVSQLYTSRDNGNHTKFLHHQYETGWWFQPRSNLGKSSQILVKTKNAWNHNLDLKAQRTYSVCKESNFLRCETL